MVEESQPRADAHGPVDLVGARSPADAGLSSLALLMQLVGTLGAVLFSVLSLLPIIAGGGAVLLFFVFISFAIRGGCHRAAGTAMLHSANPARAVHVYIGVALVHTAGMVLLLHRFVGDDLTTVLRNGLLLGIWPIALLVITLLPRFRRFFREGVPAAEDLGYEGVSVLMLLLSLMGLSVGILIVITLGAAAGSALGSPAVMLPMGVLVFLVVRSAFHFRAGLSGVRGLHHLGEEQGMRYVSLGVSSALVATCAAFLEGMMTGSALAGFIVAVLLGGMLLAWPMIVRRYYIERSFAVALAMDEAPVLRRTPDAGLTALGWFLLGSALLGLANGVPEALFGDAETREALRDLGKFGIGNELGAELRSAWWHVGVSGLQLWAGIELIRMSDHHRIATLIFAGVSIAVTAYVTWPQLQALPDLIASLDAGAGVIARIAIIGAVGMGLVLPIAAIALVVRRGNDTAVARYRGAHA
ncbi:MAG TPA: hypothetical protein VML75_14135 [Kofleriaceae bacterium]|nr:hypothetical protein [Kofleriaceae bacterium]